MALARYAQKKVREMLSLNLATIYSAKRFVDPIHQSIIAKVEKAVASSLQQYSGMINTEENRRRLAQSLNNHLSSHSDFYGGEIHLELTPSITDSSVVNITFSNGSTIQGFPPSDPSQVIRGRRSEAIEWNS